MSFSKLHEPIDDLILSNSDDEDMHVIKRSGKREIISFDKILKRVKNLGKDYNLNVNYTNLVMKVIDQLYDNISTSLIDELTAEQCASMATIHPDYSKLAACIVISNNHKNTKESFYETMLEMFNFRDNHNNNYSLIDINVMKIIELNKEYFQNIIEFDRDYEIDYFGFKTLERAYLFKINKKVIERPQFMWLRVSIGIHGNDLDKIKITYDLMSQKYFTHATPTLFNASTPRPQMSSCYLLGIEEDSIDGIFNSLKECGQISKWSGGIGLHIHNVRSSGSHIRGTNGTSNGLIPMLGVFNKTARYIDQGGKRNGSIAIYLEPHHPDIEDFLDLRKNTGDDELRARDLFYALWISDLFMKRVQSNEKWSLFCPNMCPKLREVYGEEFEKLYIEYEQDGLYKKQINARDLWIKILDAQMETGTPYLLYKDSVNKKSNQKNIGTIMSSNLCVAPETLILTDKGHLKIEDLKDKNVNVWNGKEFSATIIKQTSDESELITVKFSDQSELTCTKYHKFYIQNNYISKDYLLKNDIINNKNVELIEAQNLKPNMNIPVMRTGSFLTGCMNDN